MHFWKKRQLQIDCLFFTFFQFLFLKIRTTLCRMKTPLMLNEGQTITEEIICQISS